MILDPSPPAIDRRGFLVAGAGLGAALALAPHAAFAAPADRRADWTLAVADLEADVAPSPMRLVSGKPPADLAGVLYRNGPAKFHRPGGDAGHWFDGDGLMRAFASAKAAPPSKPASSTPPSAAATAPPGRLSRLASALGQAAARTFVPPMTPTPPTSRFSPSARSCGPCGNRAHLP